MNKKKILLTGSQGFIGSYVCLELLNKGYEVVGIDNFSKYGPITRPHDNHPNFKLIQMDVRDLDKLKELPKELLDIDYVIAGAAMIGGISYFHKYAYDLLATNERILASTFDLAIRLFKNNSLKRIIVLSSSMVFENTEVYPTPEDEIKKCPPPLSTYGFQKLSCEYFCKGAHEQYGLQYSIVRPFNCVGVGEDVALGEEKIKSGNVELMMSHVLPDIVNKILQGQDPLRILGTGEQIRCYTNGKDIAKGIRMVVESGQAVNEDFNISVSQPTSVLELAEKVWNKLVPNKNFNFISEPSYLYDVQKRIPDVTKAEKILGFKAEIKLDESIDEVISYMKGNPHV
jgi:UDP-glucose 4-epimerase